jgi:hypothetical protein
MVMYLGLMFITVLVLLIVIVLQFFKIRKLEGAVNMLNSDFEKVTPLHPTPQSDVFHYRKVVGGLGYRFTIEQLKVARQREKKNTKK